LRADVQAYDLVGQGCGAALPNLQLAGALIVAGAGQHVLSVCGEGSSAAMYLDNDPGVLVSACLFGDGAGAVVLEASQDPNRGILSVHTHAEGQYAKKLWVEAPGSSFWPQRITHEMIDEARHFPQMEGRFVFKHAVQRMPEVIEEALAHNKCQLSDVSLFLFHQANLRINEFVAQKLGISPDRTYNNIQKYGNCSAASIPMLLHECVQAGRVREGDLIAMAGFGSGFTWGSALIRW